MIPNTTVKVRRRSSRKIPQAVRTPTHTAYKPSIRLHPDYQGDVASTVRPS